MSKRYGRNKKRSAAATISELRWRADLYLDNFNRRLDRLRGVQSELLAAKDELKKWQPTVRASQDDESGDVSYTVVVPAAALKYASDKPAVARNLGDYVNAFMTNFIRENYF